MHHTFSHASALKSPQPPALLSGLCASLGHSPHRTVLPSVFPCLAVWKCWVVCTGPSFHISTMSSCPPLSPPVRFTCITRSSPSWVAFYSTCGPNRFWQILSLAGLASCHHFYVWRRYFYEGSSKGVPHTQIIHNLFRKVPLEKKRIYCLHLLWHCYSFIYC